MSHIEGNDSDANVGGRNDFKDFKIVHTATS